MRQEDRIRLAEAFRLADNVGDDIWQGWSAVPFAVLLVTPDHEFLVRHPYPTSDFTGLGYDSLLASEVYFRPRQFSLNLLATFPAVAGLSTVVIGQPERTGRSSTFWVITALHEHFHQFQEAAPDYNEAVAELDLDGGDETGMWMLNYPFPYDSDTVGLRFTEYRDALGNALDAAAGQLGEPEKTAELDQYLDVRNRLQDALEPASYRYMSFQIWKEGVARYTEHEVAETAVRLHHPTAAFRALTDFVPYDAAVDSLRMAWRTRLSTSELSDVKRSIFYTVGAAEAHLLDSIRPAWKRHYREATFDLRDLYNGFADPRRLSH